MNDIKRLQDLQRQTAGNWKVPKRSLISREYAEIERERLWPRVWQVACREEELPNVGSYVTYDILADSVIVIRTKANEIKAYNNACLHRGRRLTDEECGHKAKFVCQFHGWRWNLDGTNDNVLDQEDWEGALKKEDLKLREFKVGQWGGFVFINMDPNCQPFEEFIAPVARICDPMEFEKQRYRWYISVEVAANWKVCQAAFQEAYHVMATHPQLEPYIDQRAIGVTHGIHGQQRYQPMMDAIPGRTRAVPTPLDARHLVVENIRQNVHDIHSIYTDRDLQAAARILTEMPEGVTYQEAIYKAAEFMRDAAIATGAGFPDMTEQQFWDVGFDWTIFPNTVNVLSPTGGLWYRSLPSPDNDPDKCTFEMYALERFTPGSEPKPKKRHFKDWKDCADLPFFLHGDFINIPEIQRGLKTRGISHLNFNPMQEVPIINLHRALDEFMGVTDNE